MTTETKTAKSYRVDENGFLLSPDDWDEEFAVATAPSVGITTGLTSEHWEVIRFIRNVNQETGMVPLVYVTCMNFKMRLKDLRRLFPAGYHRGACRLAGAGYWTAQSQQWIEAKPPEAAERPATTLPRHYRVDTLGFLLDPADWDEDFALATAADLGMATGLDDEHWQVIRYLRDVWHRDGILPTLYETCEENGLELDDLRRLFPDGYHRGAVRLAGLRFWKAAPHR
jgi:tRNA 2-thiouridine synthesizing protein E